MKKLLIVLAIFTNCPVWAGELLEVDLNEVRPTQAVVGLQWVQRKIEKFEELSSKELKQKLESDPSPAVYGPQSRSCERDLLATQQ